MDTLGAVLPVDSGIKAAYALGMNPTAVLEDVYRAPGVKRVEKLAGGLPASVFPALAKTLALTSKALAGALGISERTLRKRAAAKRLTGEEANLSFQAFRVYRRAVEVLGDEEAARLWISHPQRALGERRPLDLISSPFGVEEILNVLGAVSEGVYL